MAGDESVEAIDLRHLRKSFGNVSVIDDVSLSVRAGEFLVFLGPSGCGKSTLLRMIAGLESVDSGEILIGGERIDHLPPGDRGVAMVFQHYALYPHMTVRQNLAFGLQNARIERAEIDRRIDVAASMLEIGELLDRKPTQLSGGQRQRVAIGRAIVKQPRLFLFDEPLSNLDAALRARTRVELARLHESMASTMIFVTHDQIEAMTLADRIVILNERRIEQIGTPMDIYRRPATQFVASFVGSPKINVIAVDATPSASGKAHLALGNGATLTVALDGKQALPVGAVKLGVRPEQLHIVKPGEGWADGQVNMVERLGDRTLVHSELGDGTTAVSEDGGTSEIRRGDRVGLSLKGAPVHLFDAEGRTSHAVVTSD